jgi:4-oxalocrotonate tautomerase
MPLVRIDLVRGRDKAVLMRLVQEVSEVVARTLDTPLDRVRVLVSEVDPDLWGIGGVPYSVARAPADPAAAPGPEGDRRP